MAFDPIEPATLAFDAAGVPYSTRHGDVYHSRHGALAQARHVFINGNRLTERWQARPSITVLETGFGLGVNFLATWAAWRETATPGGRLVFASCERQPFRRDDLALAWGTLCGDDATLRRLLDALLSAWPTLTPGLHALNFEGGAVTLLLYFGEAVRAVERLPVYADAIFLDGFAPDRNEDIWSPRIFHLLSRRCRHGATLATWSVAATVREAAQRAGFACARANGFAGKRQMLVGTYQGPDAVAPDHEAARDVVVVGAGLAGALLSERLSARGVTVHLLDEAAEAATGASGNLAGVLRPLPSLDDSPLSQLTRAGTAHALRYLDELQRHGHAVHHDRCGALHLAHDAAHLARQQRVTQALRFPPDVLQQVDRAEASALAGVAVAEGGWWFAQAGWVQPPSLCRAALAAALARGGLNVHFGFKVGALVPDPLGWQVLDHDGRRRVCARHVVLANGAALSQFAQSRTLPVFPARGQVSLLPPLGPVAPQVVLCRQGYLSPLVDGRHALGASFTLDDPEPALRDADHQENLAKLDRLIPSWRAQMSIPAMDGRVGFRPTTPDRLPLMGALPTAPVTCEPGSQGAHDNGHAGLWVLGGYGARGLVWSALLADALAARLTGTVSPLETHLTQALDPTRFARRNARTRARNTTDGD